jgi:hypothetical protein
LRKFCKKKGLEFHAISAAAGEGVRELVRGIADALDKIPKETLEDDAEVEDSERELLGAVAYEADDEETDEGEEGAAAGKNS